MIKWRRLDASSIPSVILDNDIGKIGTYMHGVPIDAVSNIASYLTVPYEIIITVVDGGALIEQINALGFNKNIIHFPIKDWSLTRQLLQRNKQLMENKKAKRCFIIGTGPSLLQQNLQLLADEDTIIVNTSYRDDSLISLNPKYWVVADPGFWLQKAQYLDRLLETMRDRLPITKLFIHNDSYGYMTDNDPAADRVYYYLLEHIVNYEPTILNFEKALPEFAQNVISVALMLAISLRYEEIILIGCDHSWWGYSIQDIENGVWSAHSYEENEKEINTYKNGWREHGYEKLQRIINTQKSEYEALRLIAEQSSLRIRNATAGGHLDSFERVTYEDLFI
ncbi:hypothetical protein [Cohnella cellulosilytica]|uniref:hypothetical protein n=1 Tax=Cohnella cellulosilytica TaxID=986710 RepID=UPI00360D6162